MSRKRILSLTVCSALLFALGVLTHSAWSQEVTATVVGTVTDQSGAVVPGATVKVTALDRGVTYTGESNGEGLYRIPQLPVGQYNLTVQKSGFVTVAHEPFVLAMNQIARIDVLLKVGADSTTVEVTTAAPVLETDSTTVDTVMNAATNDSLPLASRNYVQLTLLAPGSVSTDPSSFNNGNNTAGYGGRPLINGNREQANNFLLDGMDNNQVSDNLLGYTPAPDAIEEFNLITNNAPAEFGNFEGGIVSATIKSGTNSFHGDVWEYIRNDKLNANSWSNKVNPSQILPRSALRWNMFGFTVGGPILKDRLFFFADYQGQRFDIPTSQGFLSVFTTAERTGDFGLLCTGNGDTFDGTGTCRDSHGNVAHQLYNPCASSTQPCAPGSTPASPRSIFPNNVIPAAMISPVASALFSSSLYPAATGTDPLGRNDAVNTSNSAEDVDQGDLKIDYKATAKDNVSYRFTRAYQNNPSTNSFELLSNGYATTPIYNTVGDWTRNFTSNTLNDFRFGWSHITLNTGNSWDSNVGQFGNTLGIGNGNPGSLPGLLGLNFSNDYVGSIGASESTQSFDDHVWEAEDAVSWIRGRHSFKFGGQWWDEIIKTFYAGNNGELGFLDYDGQFSASDPNSAGNGNGDGAADFLLGLPYQYGRGVSTGATWQQSSNVFGIYAEDTWRATDSLTLNLGLRYDVHTPWVEANDQQANYNFATGNIDLAGKNGASRALYDGTYGGRDLQPRVGFAWTPAMMHGHTVVRGAFTVSSYLEGTGTNLRLPLNPPFTPAEINVLYTGENLPQTSSTDGVVGQGTNPSCAAPAYACYAGAFLRIWDPKVQPAIADEWNLTIQHQLGRTTTLQIGYVGQKGTHLMVPYDFGQRVLNSDGSTSNSPFFAKNLALYSALGSPTDPKDPATGINEGATISGTRSNGNMEYNSLQAVLQKQMSRGLQGQVAYTYSKCMSDSTGYYGAWNNAASASAYWQNIYDQRAEWAPCYYDATHVISAYSIYALPFGHGQRFAANANKGVDEVIGGWEVSPIVSIRTGWPLPSFANDLSGTYGRGGRADCNSGLPSIVNTAVAGVGRQWFSNDIPGSSTGATYFTQPTSGFGNCAPQLGGLRTPRYTDVDASLHKNFPITERFKLQFRSDFINLFNHPQFNAPSMGLGGGMGQITSAQPPRNIQLALKLYY
ncbi:MAG TPA: TonB-dependent receptor [Acidobacteriaceae bacterium]|nr:TonB-dependent receptor [Acidobacteriaceae bacterium]